MPASRSRSSRQRPVTYRLDEDDEDFEASLNAYNNRDDEGAGNDSISDANDDEASDDNNSINSENDDESDVDDAEIQSENDGSNGDGGGDESAVVSVEVTSPPKKKAKIANKKSQKGEHLVCKHCERKFTSLHGLRYHVDNRVCLDKKKRKNKPSKHQSVEQMEDAPTAVESSNSDPKGNNNDDAKFQCKLCGEYFPSRTRLGYHMDTKQCQKTLKQANATKKYKRFRGEEDKRTCPLCNRVFTSVLGYTYHRDKAVCVRNSAVMAYPPLVPGNQFSTKFGIVSVVKDDRAAPTPTSSKEVKKKVISKVVRRKDINQGAQLSLLIRNLNKRKLLSANYDQGKNDRESVYNAYFGGEPSTIPQDQHAVPIKRGVDVGNTDRPSETCADRIVECVAARVIPGKVDLDGHFTGQKLSAATFPTKLFLPRYSLDVPFKPGDVGMQCDTCGASFLARPSFKYHVDNTVCLNKHANSAKARSTLLQNAERRIEAVLSQVQKSNSKKVKKRKIPYEESDLQAPIPPPKYPTPLAFPSEKELKKKPKTKKEILGPDFEHPDDLLDRLARELHLEQSKMLGPMYTNVFKKLKYKEHVEKKKSKKEREIEKKAAKQALKEKQKATSAAKPQEIATGDSRLVIPSSAFPTPPMIDTVVLVAEVDSGRYPSIKRDPKRINSKQCNICKKSTNKNLVGCDFCENSVHFPCMRTRFLTKFPEPKDDFICNQCIIYIHHRRVRAEKRRAAKLRRQLETGQELAEKAVVLTESVVEGREYECVAAQGRRLNDLKELLVESRIRLGFYSTSAKANEIRRSLIHGNTPRSTTS